MKNYILFLAAIWTTVSLCSCDAGRIYEQHVDIERGGYVLKLTGRFSGLGNWADGYSVVVAGFNDKSEYAVITKSLPLNQSDGTEVVMTLGGINDEVTVLKLCVINRLRECVADFHTIECEEIFASADTIMMNVGTLDVGMYSAIQSQVFDKKCTMCHGETGTAAGNLFLTADKSYHALVNRPAYKNSDLLLVKPGEAEESFLHLVLNRDGDTNMHHLDLFSEKEQLALKLIDDWINRGAFLNN